MRLSAVPRFLRHCSRTMLYSQELILTGLQHTASLLSKSVHTNRSRTGTHLQQGPAAVDGSFDMVPFESALHGDWMMDLDIPRTATSVDVELRIGRQLHLHFSGAGMNSPVRGDLALHFNIAAAGSSLHSADHVAQMNVAGTGFSMNRARCRLLEGDIARSGTRVEAAGNARGHCISASGLGVGAPLHVLNLEVAGTRVRTNFRTDIADRHIARASIGTHRSVHLSHTLIARAGVRLDRCVFGNGNVIADRNIAQGFILNVTDADAIPILVKRRILLEPSHSLLCRQAARIKPRIAGLDVALHYHRVRISRMYGDIARATLDIEIDVPAYLQRTLEMTLHFRVRRRAERQEQRNSRDLQLFVHMCLVPTVRIGLRSRYFVSQLGISEKNRRQCVCGPFRKLLQYDFVVLLQTSQQFGLGTVGDANGNRNFALAVLALCIGNFDQRFLVFVIDDRVLGNDQHSFVLLENDLGISSHKSLQFAARVVDRDAYLERGYVVLLDAHRSDLRDLAAEALVLERLYLDASRLSEIDLADIALVA